jgi:hypothetical protein
VGLSSVTASETAGSPTAEVSADSTRTAYARGLYVYDVWFVFMAM